MNRRVFVKYLLVAPIALVAVLTRPLASLFDPEKEKDEELTPNCRTCKHKGTDFYYGLCPQNNAEADVLPQEKNQCFYYEELGQKEEKSPEGRLVVFRGVKIVFLP